MGSGGGRAGVAEDAAEDVGEEIRQQSGFLEIVGAAGGDEAGPVLEFGLPVRDTFRQGEGADLLADDLRVKEGLGFDSHVGGRIRKNGEGRKEKSEGTGIFVASFGYQLQFCDELLLIAW